MVLGFGLETNTPLQHPPHGSWFSELCPPTPLMVHGFAQKNAAHYVCTQISVLLINIKYPPGALLRQSKTNITYMYPPCDIYCTECDHRPPL